MAKRREVKISKDNVEASVEPQVVPAYEKRGWTVVDDGSSESGSKPVSEDTTAQTDAKPVTANEGGDQ